MTQAQPTPNSNILLRSVNWLIVLTLKRPLRIKLRMRWFSDVSKVKESSFFKSDLIDPPQIFDARLLENTNLSPSDLKTLKKFCFDQEVRKKMVNFKLNYGVHKVEKAWENFPHSDWLVKIMTS